MTQIQELTNKIHTLVPDTMELRFGCTLLRIDGEKEYKVITDTGFANNPYKVWVASNVRGSFGINWEDTNELDKTTIHDTQGEYWEILGHDITLEDVLRVLRDDYFPIGYAFLGGGKKNIERQIRQAEKYEKDTVFELFKKWHLGKPLHLQSEETITWLNEIIV